MKLDENLCWQAVCQRQRLPEPAFFFAVRSTGIYCLPHCPARRPRRDRVEFYSSCKEAEAAGYRACLRCRPDQSNHHVEVVEQACRYLANCAERPTLASLADRVGLSPAHFHRLFVRYVGKTPAAYARALQDERLRRMLDAQRSVTEASYAAGYGSSGAFYQRAEQALGMTPGQYRAGGKGLHLRFALGHCHLGNVLVAASPRGVCAVLLGDSAQEVLHQFQVRFAAAASSREDPSLLTTVLPHLEDRPWLPQLDLDLQGTLFQQRVWEALRRLPPGTTVSYTELAERIGQPRSARAVARACSQNPVAVIVPCHRVIGKDGQLSGYRWGQKRKAELLRRERERDRGLAAEHSTDLPQ